MLTFSDLSTCREIPRGETCAVHPVLLLPGDELRLAGEPQCGPGGHNGQQHHPGPERYRLQQLRIRPFQLQRK